MSEYPNPSRLTNISTETGIGETGTLITLNLLVGKGSVRIESISTIDQKSRDLISKRIESLRKTIAGIKKQRRVSKSQRSYLAVLNDELNRSIKERDTFVELLSYYIIVPKFKHYTVVGTADTFDKFNTLRISCTLDYSALIDLEEYYFMQSVHKIMDWFTEMFNSRDTKISSEESVTPEEIVTKLKVFSQEATSITYDWWWDRAGTSSNNEDASGVIDWTESIPLGVAGGWFTPGRRG